MTYEKMWEVIGLLSLGYTQRTVSIRAHVAKKDVALIARDYTVGRKNGQSRKSVQLGSARSYIAAVGRMYGAAA